MHVSFQYYCMRQIHGRWRKQMKRDWQRSRCVATEDCFVLDGRTSRQQSQASQARAVWSHMPHAGQQNVKETVVWGGGRSQLPGTTKEALGRRHTEVARHDTTTGVTPCAGSRDVEESHRWPLRFLNQGTRRRRRRRSTALCIAS